jgi:hypothetical protein
MGYTESPDTNDIKSLAAKQNSSPRNKGDIHPTVSATSPLSYDDIGFSKRNWPMSDGRSGGKPDPDTEGNTLGSWLLAIRSASASKAAAIQSGFEKNPGSTTSLEPYEQDDSPDIADTILHKLDTPSSKIEAANLERYVRQTDPPIDSRRSQALGLSGPFWGYFNGGETDYDALLDITPPEVKLEAAQLIHPSEAESSTVETMAGSSDDCDTDMETDLEADGEHVLNHLMICVHDMFSLAASPNEFANASTSSLPAFRQSRESSTSGSNTAGRKRGRDDTKGDRNSGDDENDKSKLPKITRSEEEDGISKKLRRKLACPYYKQDRHKHHSSGACCGPGWNSVHRIKYDNMKLVMWRLD